MAEQDQGGPSNIRGHITDRLLNTEYMPPELRAKILKSRVPFLMGLYHVLGNSETASTNENDLTRNSGDQQ